MRWDGFGRSVAFAAGVALLYPAFALVAHAWIAPRAALWLYLVAAAALYLAGLGPRRGRRGVVAGVAAIAGLGVLAVAHETTEVVIAAAVLVGVGRSALLYRRRVARAIASETLLVAGGLVLARALAAPSAAGVALALWGFFLVQSLHFVIGRARPRPAGPGPLDPFELARTRALALLEEE